MSGYFSGFSLNKITDSIATAAHKTQDTLNNALANANVNLNAVSYTHLDVYKRQIQGLQNQGVYTVEARPRQIRFPTAVLL